MTPAQMLVYLEELPKGKGHGTVKLTRDQLLLRHAAAKARKQDG